MRLIDADSLDLQEAIWKSAFKTRQDIKDLIDAQPTVEAEPVVCCKDCKYNMGSKKCLNPDSFFAVPKDDDFCSYGERKDGWERNG